MPGIKLRSQLGMTRTQVEARAIDAAKAKALEPMSGRLSMVTGVAAAVVVGVIAVLAWPHLSPLFAARPAAVAAPALPAGLDAREAIAGPTGAPLLWKAQKDKATVYLFGSVSGLTRDMVWMDPRLFSAFDNADETWFETTGLDQVEPDQSAPDQPGVNKTAPVDKGADYTLLTRARMMKKRVNSFEPGTVAPDDDADGSHILASQWRSGDERAMTAAVLAEKTQAPRDYDRRVARRTALWLPRIEKRLAGDKTTFVTVGAAHMFGPDGLIAQLRAKGYDVERIER